MLDKIIILIAVLLFATFVGVMKPYENYVSFEDTMKKNVKDVKDNNDVNKDNNNVGNNNIVNNNIVNNNMLKGSGGKEPEKIVIDLFAKLLQRQPTPDEFKINTEQLKNGVSSEALLQQIIMDSDEYTRYIKTQVNLPTPELDHFISERKILDMIAEQYKDVRQVDIPPRMTLPLRDVFIRLQYNLRAFRDVLKSPSYPSFEQDCLNANSLNRESLEAIYVYYYEQPQPLSATPVQSATSMNYTSINDTKNEILLPRTAGAPTVLPSANAINYNTINASSVIPSTTSTTNTSTITPSTSTSGTPPLNIHAEAKLLPSQ